MLIWFFYLGRWTASDNKASNSYMWSMETLRSNSTIAIYRYVVRILIKHKMTPFHAFVTQTSNNVPNRILKYRVVVVVVACFVVSLFQIHLALELICGLVPHG